MDWNHSVIFIIPIELVDVARKISHALDPDSGGYEAFASLASPYGIAPATHCIYGTPAKESFFHTIQAMIADANLLHQAVNSDYSTRWSSEIPPTLLEIQSFLTNLQTFYDQSWDSVIAETGLSIVSLGENNMSSINSY